MSITLASADAGAVPGGTRGRPLRPGTRRLERAGGRPGVAGAGLAGQPRCRAGDVLTQAAMQGSRQRPRRRRPRCGPLARARGCRVRRSGPRPGSPRRRRPLLIAERRERLIAVVGHQLSRLPCGACGGLPGPADGRVVVFRARRFAVRAARRAPPDLYLPHGVSFLPCWLRWSAVVAGDPATRAETPLAESWPGGRRAPGIGQAASGPGSQVAGAAAAAASWRTQRIRSAAAWGWSPNSWAIRLMQPRVPSRRTARLIAAATLSAAGAADRCSAEANSASHRASSTFSRVLAVLPAGDVRAGEGTGSPGAGAPRRAKRTGNPPVSRTCA